LAKKLLKARSSAGVSVRFTSMVMTIAMALPMPTVLSMGVGKNVRLRKHIVMVLPDTRMVWPADHS
jgi:hypothetical protein